MGSLKIGDVVSRKSYGGDVLFRVEAIEDIGEECIITLSGILYRIEADALESDLVVHSAKEVKRYMKMA